MISKRVRKSLFAQLLLFTCGILITLCLGFFITEQYLQRTLRETALDTNEKLLFQIGGRMEEFYDTMKSIATFVVYSPTVMEYYGQDTKGRLLLEEEVSRIFSNAVLMETDIMGISLYDISMRKIAGMGEELERAGGRLTLKENMEFGDVVEVGETKAPCYSIYFPVYDLNNREYGRQIGMCVFLMQTDSFLGFLEDTQITDHTQVYLADGENRVLETIGGEEGKLESTRLVSGREYYVMVQELGMGRWNVISRIPEQELGKEATGSRIVSVTAFFFAFIMVAVMLMYCYWNMIYRIQKIDRFIRRTSYEPELRMEENRQDELGVVSLSLNKMLDERERMNRELLASQQKMYEMELEKRQVQILAYQNQIHPHFLYNTFDCIRSMALYYNVDDIAELTMALSNTFRFAVKADHIITVEEEINNIKEYAKIIEYRFMGKIKVQIQAGQEVLRKRVIKFILQPLVENAVFHGLERKVEGGEVVVSAGQISGNRMLFVVKDNGCGIEPAQSARLKCTLEQGIPYKGIGISNIYQRLKLFYGECAELEIESSVGAGTTVSIIVPDQAEEI